MADDAVAGDPVLYERRGALALLTLNRPAVRNAVDAAMMARLEARLDRVEADDDVRVVVLTGAGSKGFCAGGDLAWFATLASRDDGLAMSRRMQAVLHRLWAGPRPVIAAVAGDAWGGGCEILTACHLRVAAESARFGFRQAAMGVVTGWGGGARLFHLVGRSHALRLLLTAEAVGAEEALRIGLVDRLAPAGEVLDQAAALGETIAANAPHSVRAFLGLAHAFDRAGGAAVTEEETRLFAHYWDGEHFRRRLAEWEARRKKP